MTAGTDCGARPERAWEGAQPERSHTNPLTLASRSPQRRAILEQLGIPFVAVAPRVEESRGGAPRTLVCENALRKARAVDAARVLGVDTAVTSEGRVFGKPRDQAEARAFLAALSGHTHEVWSGIALVEGPAERVEASVTSVTFRRLTESDLDVYLATEEWRERAGGYAIQGRGAALVERIEGDYLNVVGLSVAELVRMAPDLFGG